MCCFFIHSSSFDCDVIAIFRLKIPVNSLHIFILGAFKLDAYTALVGKGEGRFQTIQFSSEDPWEDLDTSDLPHAEGTSSVGYVNLRSEIVPN